MLGMPDLRMVLVPHPVQVIDDEQLAGLATDALTAIVERLTGSLTASV